MGTVIGLAEFLEKVGKQREPEKKVAALKYNDSRALRIILRCCYDPIVQWLLPPGKPPYKPCELVDQEHVLLQESEKLRYFLKGFGDNLQPLKREQMFMQLIERCMPADAELLCRIKDKQPIKGITLAHVVEAFPGLISNG